MSTPERHHPSYPTSLNGGEPTDAGDVRVGEEHQRTEDPGRHDRGAAQHGPRVEPGENDDANEDAS